MVKQKLFSRSHLISLILPLQIMRYYKLCKIFFLFQPIKEKKYQGLEHSFKKQLHKCCFN